MFMIYKYLSIYIIYMKVSDIDYTYYVVSYYYEKD